MNNPHLIFQRKLQTYFVLYINYNIVYCYQSVFFFMTIVIITITIRIIIIVLKINAFFMGFF